MMSGRSRVEGPVDAGELFRSSAEARAETPSSAERLTLDLPGGPGNVERPRFKWALAKEGAHARGWGRHKDRPNPLNARQRVEARLLAHQRG